MNGSGSRTLRPDVLVLDTGALVAIERGDRVLRGRLTAALDARDPEVLLPAPVLAQAWRGGAGRQAPLARFLASPALVLLDLTVAQARRVGELLARSSTSDVIDAAVALLASDRSRATVLTSDPDDLRGLRAACERPFAVEPV